MKLYSSVSTRSEALLELVGARQSRLHVVYRQSRRPCRASRRRYMHLCRARRYFCRLRSAAMHPASCLFH